MPELSVATFNTHWGLTLRRVPYDVVATCRDLDADVLVLQESFRPDGEASLGERVGDALGYDVHDLPLARGSHQRRKISVVAAGRGNGTWGVAVLSRVGGAVADRIDLGKLPLDAAHRWVLRLDVPLDGATLAVHGTHFSHLTHGSLLQLNRLRRRLPDRDQPAALLGDMNMWGPVISAFLPGWRRAVKGRTWPALRPHSQIDHILVNRGVEVVSAEVLGATGSDHRPLRALLRVAPS